MTNKELEEKLKEEGYFNLRWLKWKGKSVLCGLSKFAFTFGLIINLEEYSYSYRYCYPSAIEAIISINELKEVPEYPSDMVGNWIKCKGLGLDLSNPNYKKLK